jgi:hypothetical protein
MLLMQGQEQQQYIKEKVKERYGKIALTGNSDCCCVPGAAIVLTITTAIPLP